MVEIGVRMAIHPPPKQNPTPPPYTICCTPCSNAHYMLCIYYILCPVLRICPTSRTSCFIPNILCILTTTYTTYSTTLYLVYPYIYSYYMLCILSPQPRHALHIVFAQRPMPYILYHTICCMPYSYSYYILCTMFARPRHAVT